MASVHKIHDKGKTSISSSTYKKMYRPTILSKNEMKIKRALHIIFKFVGTLMVDNKFICFRLCEARESILREHLKIKMERPSVCSLLI